MTPENYAPPRAFAVADAVMLLSRTPPALDSLLLGVPETWTRANEGVDTWSAFDVVGHLLHGERSDWIPRARHLLAHGETVPFAPVDRVAQLAASRGRTLEDLLQEFAVLRATSIRELQAFGFNEEDLDRRGRHPEFGRVTLRQLLATWVAHDLDHVAQIARVLARQYSEAVGPWRAYLRVIHGGAIAEAPRPGATTRFDDGTR